MSNIDSHEWLKTLKNISCFEFTEHKLINESGFRIVKSAKWNSCETKVAFKSLKEYVIKKFVKGLLISVNFL